MPTTERYALNDLQQAVLDTLAEELMNDRPCVEREALAELIQAIPGHGAVTGVGLGPCLAALKRRGLVAHPVGDKRCRQVYITAAGMEYATDAANEEGGGDEEELDDPGSYCASCNAPEYAPHREGCEYQPTAVAGRANDPMTRIDPETRRVVLPESDRQAAEQDEGEAAPAVGHDFKRCRHCQVQFKRPDEAPIPDDRCERCHEEVEARAAATSLSEELGVERYYMKSFPAKEQGDGQHYPPGAEALQQGCVADRVEAPGILRAALGHLEDRATTYDAPAGERSMAATVAAFAEVAGIHLTEEQGWLFMALLKAVRSQQGAYRADSYEDGAAYFALAGEAAANHRETA